MIANIVSERNFGVQNENTASKIYHKSLIGIDKVFFYGYTKTETGNYLSGIVYAYECGLTRDDVADVQNRVNTLLNRDVIPEYRSVWNSNLEIERPEERGYDDSYDRYRDRPAGYDDIQEYIKETQYNITNILNKNNILVNALKTWTDLQPDGSDTKSFNSGREASNINGTLFFLRRNLHFLLIAEEIEIRTLYQTYIDKTISYYEFVMNELKQ